MTQPTPEDLAAARLIMLANKKEAVTLVHRLLVSCRARNGEAGSEVARELHGRSDPYLLMMVLGQLAVKVVELERTLALERAVAEAPSHTDLPTAEDLGFTPEELKPETWQIGVQDQLQAAMEAGDSALFGKMAVDAQLRSAREDKAEGRETGLAYTQRCMALVHPVPMAVIAAEMLHRLIEAEHE